MAFLKNLGEKISGAAVDAADKAKEFADVTRLKNEIAGEEKKIQQSFVELGKLYFETIKDNTEGPGIEHCQAIRAAEAAIAELKEKIEQVKTN
ncbi:MAG: hypothetical protein RBT15_07215 [Gudongella sp.]|nr:hypothetical protein [Gudongella sp.]